MKKIIPIFAFLCALVPNISNAFDYEQCMNKAVAFGDDEQAKCKHSQMLIELKNTQDLYDVIASDPNIKVLTRVEIKQMYDNWLNHRNAYCKLYAASQLTHNENYNREHCMQEYTKNAYFYMKALIDGFYQDPD